MKIAASILSADFSKLGEEICSVTKAGADLVHLDIMDGHFVPNLTFGPTVIQKLPKPSGVLFDAHLMINNPERNINTYFNANIDYLSVHIESTIHLQRLLNDIRKHNIKPAIALNPSTPLYNLDWILDDVDMILIMTVNPGFAGQFFLNSMLKKIEQLKNIIISRGLPIEVEVDGGVTANNIQSLVNAGVDIAVVGSAIFNQSNYLQVIQSLKDNF